MTRTAKHPRRRDRGQAGFGLTELMISMSIILVVLGTTMGALMDGVDVAGLGSDVADTQQNARAGLTLMRQDLMLASQGIPMGGIPIPSGGLAQAINRPGPTAMTFPANWVVLPAVSPGSAQGLVSLGRPTDILTIVYADSTLALNDAPVDSISADGGTVVAPSSIPIGLAGNRIRTGDFIMFTNAIGTAIQEVTTVTGQIMTFGALDSMRLNQRNAGQGTIMQLQSGAGLFPPTTATRVWMISYYIDEPAPGTRRLIRRVNNGIENPVALDVGDLQVTYDLVDGVTNPAGLDDVVTPQSPAQIRKVNLVLTTRSNVELRSTGRHHRQTVSTSVSLRSLSFLDRYM